MTFSTASARWNVADGIGNSKSPFKRGEMLFGKLRPYFHKVDVAPIDSICSTDIVVAAPKFPEWFGFVLWTHFEQSFSGAHRRWIDRYPDAAHQLEVHGA